MIGRLREAESGEDPVLKRATELLHSLEATEESALSRRRVWLSVVAEPRRMTRTQLLARPAFAAVLVVCLSAAAAGASVGRGFLSRVATALASIAEPMPSPSAPRAATRSRELAQRGALAASPKPEGASGALPRQLASPVASEPTRATGRPARAAAVGVRPELAKRSSADAFAAAPREEASLVLGAMTALRRDHDPARSAQMLGDYLHKYPRGVLREEALALRIEAASSLRDPTLGASLARGYLQSHPNGRFRDLAKSALSSDGAPKP